MIMLVYSNDYSTIAISKADYGERGGGLTIVQNVIT